MLKFIKLLAGISSLLCGVALLPALADEPSAPMKASVAPGQSRLVVHPDPDPSAIKFDLDFPGGTANELIAAINTARGKPVNVVFSGMNSAQRLPAVKVNQVTVTQLFTAMARQNFGTGLATAEVPDENSVWFFQAMPMNSEDQQFCGFYSLAAYLENGFTVDDITTAVQTGWKMLGISPLPQLSYHKETKLLIAVGLPRDVRLIDEMLKALNTSKAKPSTASQPVSAEPHKAP